MLVLRINQCLSPISAMSLLVNRLSSNITKLLSNNILNNAPESVPIRHHVGYIPAQGRIHPWDTEESRVQRQVRFILHIKMMVKNLKFPVFIHVLSNNHWKILSFLDQSYQFKANKTVTFFIWSIPPFRKKYASYCLSLLIRQNSCNKSKMCV